MTLSLSIIVDFKEFISDIYPKELTISENTESTSVAFYPCLLEIEQQKTTIMEMISVDFSQVLQNSVVFQSK